MTSELIMTELINYTQTTVGIYNKEAKISKYLQIPAAFNYVIPKY